MATSPIRAEVFYPESDGKPMAETVVHRDVMIDLIVTLKDWFAADPLAYVSGNEFLYFVEGDPRRAVSPDVWCVRGIDKTVNRPSYKTWQEDGKAPDLVVEVSSPSTRREDLRKKFDLYRDVLKVREYFLFDPLGEYLKPPLKGYRLAGGEYEPIEPVAGRLPSEVLALHLEADGPEARLFDPATGRRLPTRLEAVEIEKAGRMRSEEELRRVQAEILRQSALLQQSDAEADRLRRELEALKAGKRPKKRE